MLIFNKKSDSLVFQQSLDSIANEYSVALNYRQDVLLPAIKEGNWAKLAKMVIYQDEKITIRFGEEKWAFKDSNIKAKSPENLYFSIGGKNSDNVINIRDIETEVVNQIKCVALLRMYYVVEKITFNSVTVTVNWLRRTGLEMFKHNVFSFEEITENLLRDWIQDGADFTSENAFIGLNLLVTLSEALPFTVNFNRMTHKRIGVKVKEGVQHPVIPPRIYFSFLNQFSEAVNHAYQYRDEIEKVVEELLVYKQTLLNRRITKLRYGDVQVTGAELKNSKTREFLCALQNEGIDLIDYERDARWMQLYKQHQPLLRVKGMIHEEKTFTIAGNPYLYTELRRYLFKLNYMAAWLCHALSGMRTDELFSMHPNFGAQSAEFRKIEHEGALEKVYLLTTRQSKITNDSQKKDDVFVTTYTGFKSFFVLDAIHRPFRRRLPNSERNSMLVNLRETSFPKTLNKGSMSCLLSGFINSYEGINFTLTRQDVDYLDVSEKSHSYKAGDIYKVTPHQCRRSIAYYLIGYELCSFPALKQQLGHFSMAMTRWYARNASSYRKFWSEVVNERIRQQAEIYVRIFKRMANGERIAGGKGKTYLNSIAKSGENYFEEGVNKRLLTVQYWEEMLRNKKEHLHAIAPGMYCTNDNCSMRIAIDLTECVNCEYDYIENVVYAESSRMDGMRNLGMLIEMNDLNASSATRCYMQIKAAERIMTDLEYDYEPYEFPKEVKAMVIVLKEIC